MQLTLAHKVLGGLLGVQVALSALMWMPGSDAPVEAKKLISSGANGITKVSVTRSGADAKPVELVSEGGNWAISSEGGYPADATKVTEMLDALAKIELRTPIASNAESYAKLKVADDDFGKKVVFTADGAEHTLLVGAAASKAVYLRVDGGAEVYKVKGFSEFVFKDAARSFWKTNYVEFNKDDVTSFSISKDGAWSLAFKKEGDAWVVDGQPGVAAKSDKVTELIGKAAALRLSEPVGKENKAEYGLDAGFVKIDWTAKSGDQTTSGSFKVGVEKDGKHYAQAQGNPFFVTVPKYTVKEMVEATPETLTETGAASAPAPGDAMPIDLGSLPPGAMPPGAMPPGAPPTP